MATATKTTRTLTAAGTALAANGTVTSTTWNGLTALGGLLTIRLATGSGTVPTTGATATVNVSTDGATWRPMYKFTGGLTVSTFYDFVLEVPPPTMELQVVFVGGATGTTQTCEAFLQELTSIA